MRYARSVPALVAVQLMNDSRFIFVEFEISAEFRIENCDKYDG